MFCELLHELDVNHPCQSDTEHKKLTSSPIAVSSTKRRSWHGSHSPVRTIRRMSWHGVRSTLRRLSSGRTPPASPVVTSRAKPSFKQTTEEPELEENAASERLSVTNATKLWLSEIDDGLGEFDVDLLKAPSSAKDKGKQRQKQPQSKQQSPKCDICRKPFPIVRCYTVVVNCYHSQKVNLN